MSMNREQELARLTDLEYQPRYPSGCNRGIGIVGAGEIVLSAHLPAYRLAGFRVAGIYDVNRGRAEELARLFGIPHVFSSLDAMLAHPGIDVVDIAVPARHQPDVVKRVAAAGKHMLCQKPLAESYKEAVGIVQACEDAGVKAAVNQQMRWAPGIRASRSIVRRGWIGEPVQASIQVNVRTPWENWPWLTQIDTLEVMYHSIHYLDSIRSVMGMKPESIYADGAKWPGQAYNGETRTLMHIRFPGEARGLVHDNHNNGQPQDDWYAMYRFEGTEGVVKGTNGTLYNYPHGREDTLSFYSNVLLPGFAFSPRLEGRWFPHGFIGTMGELLLAIEEDREPENSVRDNLITMQLVFAAYRSMREDRPVRLEEIAGEAPGSVQIS